MAIVAAAVFVVSVITVVRMPAIRIAARAGARTVITPWAAVVARCRVIAVPHINIGLRHDRRARRVAVVTVIARGSAAITVAVHWRAVRIDRAAAKQGRDHDAGEWCKTFHFVDQCERITTVRPLLSPSLARGLYVFVRIYFFVLLCLMIAPRKIIN